MELEKQFLSAFLEDLNARRVELPSLPEVALRIRKIIEDPSSSVSQIAKIINADPALTARLIRVANSPLRRPVTPITSIQLAITRLGAVQVRNIVTALVLQQLYQVKKTDAIKKEFQALWSHSTQVATLSSIIARNYTKLSVDEAMLAGLIHDIGVLPILMRAELFPELIEKHEALQRVIRRLHTIIGTTMLEEWHFPAQLIAVTTHHENIHAVREGPVDFVDVVILANLHSYFGTNHPLAKVDWGGIPAFAKLGLTPDDSIAIMQESQKEVLELRNLLAA